MERLDRGGILHEGQAGFGVNRSCMDNVFMLSELVQDLGVKGRMWRVIKKMYDVSRSAVLLEGEKSTMFTLEQGVAQGCSLSPILFSVKS